MTISLIPGSDLPVAQVTVICRWPRPAGWQTEDDSGSAELPAPGQRSNSRTFPDRVGA